MIDRVRENLSRGIVRLKWIGTYLARRTKAETSVAKLLYESSKLEDRMNNLYRDIGVRVEEIENRADEEDKDVLRDSAVRQSLVEVKKLRESLEERKSRARDMNKITE